MANTITDLKDVRISQAALMPWMTELLPLTAFSTNFSPDAADKLDTIKVPVIGMPSASSDYEDDYTANSDSEASSVPVVLNRHKYKTVHLTAKEAATTAIPLLEKLVTTAAQQLAIDVMTDIFSCITAANYGSPAIPALPAEEFNYKTIIKIREACAAGKMPQDQRSLILDNSFFSSLLADDIVAKSFITPLAQSGVVDAKINRIAGFSLYETNCVPVSRMPFRWAMKPKWIASSSSATSSSPLSSRRATARTTSASCFSLSTPSPRMWISSSAT